MLDVGFGTLYEVVRPFLLKLSFLVGGIFGLYLILILVRVYYERRKVKLLQAIRYDLDRLNMHHGVSYSRERKGFFMKMFSELREKRRSKKVERGFRKLERKKHKKRKK